MSEDCHDSTKPADMADGPVPQGAALCWPPGRLVAGEPAPELVVIDEIAPLPGFSALARLRPLAGDMFGVPPALVFREARSGFDRFPVPAASGRAHARRERRRKRRGRRR